MTAGSPSSFRWWYLPSWLGLDAPCVVTTWCWAASESCGLKLHPGAALALWLTVWAIYLVDRMVDVLRCDDWSNATGRMHFGRRRFVLFAACLVVCLLGLAVVVFTVLPGKVMVRGLWVAAGFAAYFLLFVLPVFAREKLLGKEFGVGLFFGLGSFAALGYEPAAAPLYITIAVLVAYNCLVIAAREKEKDLSTDPSGAASWWTTMQRDLIWIGLAGSIVFATLLLVGPTPFYLAALSAMLAMTLLHRLAHRFSEDAVRALADFCLLTPWLMMWAS